MNHDDFDQMVAGSYEARAADLAEPPPSLGAVHRRVGRRRRQRRTFAGVGAAATIAAAGVGLVMLDREPAFAPAATPATVGSTPGSQIAWRCSDQFNYFEVGIYFAVCEQVPIPGEIQIFPTPDPTIPPPTTVEITPPPELAIATTAPPTSPPPITVPEPASVGTLRYQVQEGDNPSRIAERYGITVEDLAEANANVPNFSEFLIGGWILVPLDRSALGTSDAEQIYVVQVGDSLSAIADFYGVTAQLLVAYNEFPDGIDHVFFPGDEMRVPPGALDRRSVLSPLTRPTQP